MRPKNPDRKGRKIRANKTRNSFVLFTFIGTLTLLIILLIMAGIFAFYA